MNPRDRWATAADRNQVAVRERSVRQFDDERFDWLRRRPARVAVVVAYVTATVVMAWTWYLGTAAGVGGLALWGCAFVALHRSVRSVADLPDDALDERLRRDRDASYVSAYRLVAGVLGVAMGLLFVQVVVADANEETDLLTVGVDDTNAVFWVTFSLLLGVPSIAMAWRRDPAELDS